MLLSQLFSLVLVISNSNYDKHCVLTLGPKLLGSAQLFFFRKSLNIPHNEC